MAGKVQEAKLDTRKARARLERGDRKTHWRALPSSASGRFHLGYERGPDDKEGRWVLRRYQAGRYNLTPLALADDARDADGDGVLDFEQAYARARARLERPLTLDRMSVRQAFERYVDFKKAAGQPVGDLMSRGRAHILPTLGDLVVAELTADRLRKWHTGMAAGPAQVRPKAGKVQFKPAPAGDDAVRARRASANRVLTMLKASLNHAYDEGHISNRDAWGRKLKPFREVEVARVRYLSVAEARRLINASDIEFRPLIEAALQTGCRYGELTRLEVQDFNPDAGTVAVRRSKSGRPRHVVLTDEGISFFKQHCAGHAGHEMLFRRANSGAWKASEQGRPMDAACEAARISPPITFHGLRHTYASLSTMAGMPLTVLARNLGHVDTKMCERHYSHLAPNFIAEQVRAAAPRFGFDPDRKLVTL
jgi:integrase